MKTKFMRLLSVFLVATMLLSNSVVFASETAPVETNPSQTTEQSTEATEADITSEEPPETEEASETETETDGEPESNSEPEAMPGEAEQMETETDSESEETESEAAAETESEVDAAAQSAANQVIRTMNEVLRLGDAIVAADKFMVYKDGELSSSPSAPVIAGDLSDTAPDLTSENLYFDHAEVNGKRVYEVGTLEDITYYSSISGSLSILGEDETIDLYYVTKYPITYSEVNAVVTAKEELVEKGGTLTFRVKPSAKGKRLIVNVGNDNIADTGTIYDSATGEMLFTVENVQKNLAIMVTENDAEQYSVSYNTADGMFRNGRITSANNQAVTPGGSVTVTMESEGNLSNRYVLNMLVINGEYVNTPPTNAGAGAYAETALSSGETIRVTLTQEDSTSLPIHYANDYSITISNIYTDIYISEANFKRDDRREIILKELDGIDKIVGWDGASERYVEGSINHVYAQTEGYGNYFFLSLQPGYADPELTVRSNGSDQAVALQENPNTDNRYPAESYPYVFDIPNNLSDNMEIYLKAAPIEYTVQYINDKNSNDLIGDRETDFTVEPGRKDTITITSRTPYETVAGFSPDGYILQGTEGPVYRSGETVKVADLIDKVESNTITFVPNWVSIAESGDRQIMVNLYVEDPTNGDYEKAATYPVTVGQGKALLRPDDARGREYLTNYISGGNPDAPAWATSYNSVDFTLKTDENKIHVVEAETDSLDFHYDVKKATLKVNFAWGTDETESGDLPQAITKEIAIRQGFSVDISNSIPQGYMAALATTSTGDKLMNGTLTGTAPNDAKTFTKTVYLYRDNDGDKKPDSQTIELKFNVGDYGAFGEQGLTPGYIESDDGKTLTYKLVKAGADGIMGDKYPAVPPVTVTGQDGYGFRGWVKQGGSADNQGDLYANYAGKVVSADAANVAFEAAYAISEGYELFTVERLFEQENGEFKKDETKLATIQRLETNGASATFPRTAVDGYVTPNEGESGSHTIVVDRDNTVRVKYYLDKDNNDKPDTYTVTLTFQGTGNGKWDTDGTNWEGMTQDKDYIYDENKRSLVVSLVKTNDAGFTAENYPEAPKVDADINWLFDSWQNTSGKTYGSGTDGDGITIGTSVGASNTDKSYTTVYKEDKNNDGKADDTQSVTVTFQAGDHGTLEGKTEYEDLLPSKDNYPVAPTVKANENYVFAGWSPSYAGKANSAVKDGDNRNQTYTATYKEDKNNDGIADDTQSVNITFVVGEHGSTTDKTQYDDLLPQKDNYPAAPTVTADEGYVFTGWTPEYNKTGSIETNAMRNQTYTAVIKEDKNGNGTPDDQESTYMLIYDDNAQSDGTVSGTPEDKNEYLTLQEVTLDEGKSMTHSNVNESKVVFLGWSKEKTTQIYGKEDKAAFQSVTLVKTVTFAEANETVYAVWGYQSEGNDKPDVQEDYWQVTTSLSGGDGSKITPENPLVKDGADQEFTITAGSSYALKTIAVDGNTQYTNDGRGEEFTGIWTLANVQNNCTVSVTFGADEDGDGLPDEYQNPNLKEVVRPDAITDVANGTALDKIDLPETVTIKTTDGDKQANVTWTKESDDYDPNKKEAQTFTLNGTVKLPEGVDNRNNLPLMTEISITVAAEKEPEVPILTGLSIKTNPTKTTYTEGETLDLSGLVVTLSYSNNTTEDVALANFEINTITVSPENGTALSTTHKQVTVSKGGFSAVFNIVVNAMEQVATPEFSVEGGNYTEVQKVELSTTTEGATIYYTTDGTTPTAESVKYEGVITVDKTMTISAIAVKDGMKNSEVATATYIIQTAPVVTEYTLTVENGTGSGSYVEGAEITIQAAEVEGKVFVKWTTGNGGTFADENSAKTTFTMPGNNVTVTAIYKDEGGSVDPQPDPGTKYTLTVENGAGDGEYAENAEITIKADAAPEGKVFDKWVSTGGIFADAGKEETTFVMPGFDVTVTATYKDKDTTTPGGDDGSSTNPGSGDDDTTIPDGDDGSENPGGNNDGNNDEQNKPGTDEQNGAGQTDKNNPKTGDETNLWLWIVLLALSGTGLTIMIALNRRKHQSRQ